MISPRGASALLLALLASGCAGIIPDGGRSAPPPPVERAPVTPQPLPPAEGRAGESAGDSTLRLGPPVAALSLNDSHYERALAAFQRSCTAISNRADASGLTSPADWGEPCRDAEQAGDARRFFARHFATVSVGDGQAFATGYYEPEIAASLRAGGAYRYPIYALPPDNRSRQLTREEIERGALDGRGLEIAWASDPVALYFFQVQGGGLLRLPDGRLVRLVYAGNNGHDYVSIGRLMRDRGLVGAGQTTAQGLQAWLRDNPERGRAIMQENPRFIYYARSDRDGPVGSLGAVVTPRATVAVDPAFVPYGAPVFLDVAHDIADGLWIAQDSGGAIHGANRFDTFWGAGEEAHAIAGGMASRGRALIFLPRTSVARLGLDR